MFSNIFFQSNTTPSGIQKAKTLTDAIAEDIRALKEKILALKLQRTAPLVTIPAIEENPVMTKAQEMVYHLKHTKNSISLN